VHDSSERAARTRLLIEHTSAMVARLVRLSRLPVVRPLIRQTVELMALLSGPRD
jgi:hypothetical protein